MPESGTASSCPRFLPVRGRRDLDKQRLCPYTDRDSLPGSPLEPLDPARSSSLEINQGCQLQGAGKVVSQSARLPMGGELPEISAAVRRSSGPEGAPDPRR